MDPTTLFLVLVVMLLLIMMIALSGLIFLWLKSIPLFATRLTTRQQLLYSTVYQYRLSKMLHYLGVRVEDYVRRIPEFQIKKHIVRCRSCPNIPTCDQCLHDGKFVSDMHFCPNYQSLMSYSKIMPSVER